MPHASQAETIEHSDEQQALEFFKEVLGKLPDTRQLQGQRYPLILVIVVALVAINCGCNSAYPTGAGLVLGATKTDAKSNGITAIPELVRLLDISGATITIDAMGTQSKISKTIRDGDAHYLLAVKDSQPMLHGDINTVFTTEQSNMLNHTHRCIHPGSTHQVGDSKAPCIYRLVLLDRNTGHPLE